MKSMMHMHEKTIHAVCARIGPQQARLAFTAALLLIAWAARAQNINESEPLADFGLLSQYNSSVTFANALNVQPVACVPTSFANSLTFLDNVNGGDLFKTSPDSYDAVNTLAQDMNTSFNRTPTGFSGGTGYSPAVNGFLTYTGGGAGQNSAPGVKIFGEYSNPNWGVGLPKAGAGFLNAKPSAFTLGAALASECAIELGIQWGSYNGTTFTPDPNGGFHAITLRGLNLVNGAGFGDIIDPISAQEKLNDANANGNPFSVSLSTVDGFLYMTFPTVVADNPAEGGDNDFAGPNGETARVVADWIETVPDNTSTLTLLGSALTGLAFAARRTQKNNAALA